METLTPKIAGCRPYSRESVTIHRKQSELWGFTIGGGTIGGISEFECGDCDTNRGIFILRVELDGPAARTGRLRRGDRIIRANGIDCSNRPHSEFLNIIHSTSERLELLIQHNPASKELQVIPIVKPPKGGELGIIIGSSNELDQPAYQSFVAGIKPDGAADRDGRLQVEIIILKINAKSLAFQAHDTVDEILRAALVDSGTEVVFTVCNSVLEFSHFVPPKCHCLLAKPLENHVRIETDTPADESGNECRVCLDKKMCILLRPCNNLCICGGCAENRNICPICRGPVQSYEKVYFS